MLKVFRLQRQACKLENDRFMIALATLVQHPGASNLFTELGRGLVEKIVLGHVIKGHNHT